MKRYFCLFVAVILISGCAPKESTFMQSMNARWTEDKTGFNLSSVDKDSKLLMIDDTGGILLFTPSGKLDTDNNLMPVTASIYTPLKSANEVLLAAAMLVCPNFAMMAQGGALFAILQNQLISECFEEFNNQKVLPEKLRVVKESLHNGEQGKFILFNASKTPDKEVKFGLKKDDGTAIYNSGFVRKLTEEEQKTMASYSEKLAARNSLIDKAIDEVATSFNNANLAKSKEIAAVEAEAKKTSEAEASSAVAITASGVEALPK